MREEKLVDIIVRSRIALGLPDLDEGGYNTMAEEFNCVLDPGITVENLDEVYTRAMMDKETGYQLSSVELNAAYRSIKQVEVARRVLECPGCQIAKEQGRECPYHKR